MGRPLPSLTPPPISAGHDDASLARSARRQVHLDVPAGVVGETPWHHQRRLVPLLQRLQHDLAKVRGPVRRGQHRVAAAQVAALHAQRHCGRGVVQQQVAAADHAHRGGVRHPAVDANRAVADHEVPAEVPAAEVERPAVEQDGAMDERTVRARRSSRYDAAACLRQRVLTRWWVRRERQHRVRIDRDRAVVVPRADVHVRHRQHRVQRRGVVRRGLPRADLVGRIAKVPLRRRPIARRRRAIRRRARQPRRRRLHRAVHAKQPVVDQRVEVHVVHGAQPNVAVIGQRAAQRRRAAVAVHHHSPTGRVEQSVGCRQALARGVAVGPQHEGARVDRPGAAVITA